MKTIFLVLAIAFILPTTVYSQSRDDTVAVLEIFESWNEGWANADATLAVQDYADADDVTFLSPDVALIRSKLVRTGQKTSTGTPNAWSASRSNRQPDTLPAGCV